MGVFTDGAGERWGLEAQKSESGVYTNRTQVQDLTVLLMDCITSDDQLDLS